VLAQRVAAAFLGRGPGLWRGGGGIGRLGDLRQHRDGRCGSAESREWAGLASHYRMALVLLAGIDGEIEELALRDWREMPPPERDAIRRQIRALRSCLLPLRALALRT